MASPQATDLAFQGLDKALRWLRLQAGRKQREVARASGVTQSMLCSYEQGVRQPSLASLEKILTGLGTDLRQLCDALDQVNGRRRPAAARVEQGLALLLEAAPGEGVEGGPVAEGLLAMTEAGAPLTPGERALFRQLIGAFVGLLRLLRARLAGG